MEVKRGNLQNHGDLVPGNELREGWGPREGIRALEGGVGPWQARLRGQVLELCRKGEGSFRRVENILNGRNSVNQDSEVETIGLFRAPIVYESWEEIARWWGGHGGGGHWV